MSRFFKSAAFPILIVIVLAFFASKLISASDQPPKPNFGQFMQQADPGKAQTAVMRTKDTSIEVTLDGWQKYTTGIPGDTYAAVVTNKLPKAQEDGKPSTFPVKPARSSVLLSLL